MTDRGAARAALAGFALVALAGVLLRPAMPIDETRYLAAAWEMWLSGDWLVPTKNFAIYSDKPPLLFWTIDAVWAVTGVSQIAARLVGPAFAVLCIWLTGRLARALWPDDREAGPRAVLALSGMLAFAFFGGLTMFDAALSAATVAAMLALVSATRTGRWRAYALLGLAIAAGVLAKGPVILIHVGPALLLAPLWAGRRVPPPRHYAGAGVALLAALAAVGLWLVPAIVTGGPDYREAILWTQSAGRVSESFAHAQPVWFYAALLPLLLFPWIAVPALWRASKRRVWGEPAMRLCLIWAGGAFLLFGLISGKQIHYLLPELPAAALVVARLTRLRPDAAPREDRASLLFPALPVLLLAAILAAAASGLVPLGREAALLHPRSVLLAVSLLAVAAAWAAARTGGLRGGVVLSLGLLVSANLAIGLTDTRDIYDTQAIARAVAPFEADGIAMAGQDYHAEFNFTGRLTGAVANPGEDALADWVAAHPGGVVVGRTDRVSPGWPPRETYLFRNAPYAIWHVADAPRPEPSA